MNVADLTHHLAEWLQGGGSDGDVVVSSRVRLARNLAGMPFLSRCTPGQVREIAATLRGAVTKLPLGNEGFYADMESADPLDRAVLVERHLISKQHAEGSGPRGVAVSGDEVVAAMVNEEDHLRMQVLGGGLDLDNAYARIARLEELLEQQLKFAFTSRLGYLTACPTNVGTGLRVSVMLHLPALKIVGQLDKALRAARDMHLAVRGLYGEGTEAIGDLYQVSNQTTLGVSEERIVRDFCDQVAPAIIRYERTAREALLKNRRLALEDRVHRALAVLRAARLLSSEEALYLLGHVRLGASLKLLPEVSLRTISELSMLTKPAHLQRYFGREMTASDRGEARAGLIRQRLGGP